LFAFTQVALPLEVEHRKHWWKWKAKLISDRLPIIRGLNHAVDEQNPWGAIGDDAGLMLLLEEKRCRATIKYPMFVVRNIARAQTGFFRRCKLW